MKRNLQKLMTLFFVLAFSGLLVAQEKLMISEVADPSDVYQARFVELYNGTGSTIDFSTETWYLSRQANGSSTSWAEVQLTGTLSAGGLFRIAYSQSQFETSYGFSPEMSNGSVITGNGDDGYFLYKNGDHSTGTLVDAYGVIDQDGTGQAWEYLDGHAERNAGVSQANTTWTASEWTITRPAATTDMNPNDTALPVELSSFTAAAGDAKVTLHWTTASEVDNQGFAILRSEQESAGYSEIDSYISNSELKGAGNSSHTLNYQYVDKSVVNDQTYWYKLVDVDVNGVRTEHGPVQATPKAENTDNPGTVPRAFNLKNFPNPFNPGTTISFDLSSFKGDEVNVELVVYDLLGKKITTLVSGKLEKKSYTFHWNGIDDNGHNAPTGVYIYSFQSPQMRQSKKMILMR